MGPNAFSQRGPARMARDLRCRLLFEMSRQRGVRAGHGERVARRRADHLPVLRPIDKAVIAVRRSGHRDRTAFRKCAGAADGAVGSG